MGRPRTQNKCKIRGCGKPAKSRNMCGTHHQQWNRAVGHLRCEWPGCRNHQEGGGRRMRWNGVTRFYCRVHEVEHLRPTPDIEALNIARLGAGIVAYQGCWIWIGGVNSSHYGTLVPEGGNHVEWLAHRVVWNLLMGGHRPWLELDHRTCKQRACVNPLHLEPVTRSENERRKHGPADRVWINQAAAESSCVREFAQAYGLPIRACDPGVRLVA